MGTASHKAKVTDLNITSLGPKSFIPKKKKKNIMIEFAYFIGIKKKIVKINIYVYIKISLP